LIQILRINAEKPADAELAAARRPPVNRVSAGLRMRKGGIRNADTAFERWKSGRLRA
jgi:hypothetical protein